MEMVYYLICIIALFCFRIVRILIFWMMSDKAAERVSKACKNNLTVSEIIKGIEIFRNKGNPEG